jgi:hypothetical protein
MIPETMRSYPRLPRLDAPLADVLDAALAVDVVGIEADGPGRLVQVDGAALGVAAADDARPVGLVGRKVRQGPLARGFVSAAGLLDLSPRRAELRPEEPLQPPSVAHVGASTRVHKIPLAAGARASPAGETD